MIWNLVDLKNKLSRITGSTDRIGNAAAIHVTVIVIVRDRQIDPTFKLHEFLDDSNINQYESIGEKGYCYIIY